MLLVEDDPSIRELAQLGLSAAGFRVTTCADGREALERLRRDPFDLAVVDVMLPARADATDVIVGLELGADDDVTKPFDMPVLVARCRAVLRRANAEPAEPVLRVGDLEIDPAAFVVRREGADLAVTATEFRLLLELARHPGQVMTRELLLQRVWDHEFLGDSRLVDVAVQRLRAKIEPDPTRPSLIATVRGVGYRFERS